MRSNKLFKRLFFCADILLLLVSVALIALNLFVVNFPAWVVVLFAVVALAGLTAYLLIFRTFLITKIILPLVFTVTAVFASVFAYSVPYWNSYTLKSYNGKSLNFDEVIEFNDARDDLYVAVDYLKRTHPIYSSNGGSSDAIRAEIDKRVETAVEELRQTHGITPNKLRRAVQYIVNPLHDAHTLVYDNYSADRYLLDAPKMQSAGYKIVSVAGSGIVNPIPVEEIFETAKLYTSYESEDWISMDLGKLSSLELYGFSAPFRFVWDNGDGNPVTKYYDLVDFDVWKAYLKEYRTYIGNPDDHKAFVYYDIDDEKSLITLTLTSCTYNSLYKETVREMFYDAKFYGIKNIAVDLRGNGGGNSMVANEFVRYLPVDEYSDMSCDWRWNFFNFHADGKTKNDKVEGLTFDGNIFVLTDHKTFSAAMDFAMIIQDNKLGKVVGESPANAVNGFGDVAVFVLPNSGLYMQISTKKWYRCDQTNTDEYVIPDSECPGEEAFDTLYTLLG